jgi:hypothetical protein
MTVLMQSRVNGILYNWAVGFLSAGMTGSELMYRGLEVIDEKS